LSVITAGTLSVNQSTSSRRDALPEPANDARPAKAPFWSLLRRRPKRAPAGQRIYAVGDVHGRADLLAELLAQIEHEERYRPGRPTLLFLGDYVDRGVHSRQVIDLILALSPARYDLRLLRGNHEAAMLDFLARPETGARWLALGGAETLYSYGVHGAPRSPGLEELVRLSRALAAALPPSHLGFLEGLEAYVRLGDYLFVHAGLRPGRPLARQTEADMLEIREPFLRSRARWPYVVVHGHSPVPVAVQEGGRIALDTGAYATGRLSAVCLEDDSVRFLATGGGVQAVKTCELRRA
jgi:serine/threonine protein phosphatase 1